LSLNFYDVKFRYLLLTLKLAAHLRFRKFWFIYYNRKSSNFTVPIIDRLYLLRFLADFKNRSRFFTLLRLYCLCY